MKELITAVNKRFDQVYKKIDKLDKKVDNLEGLCKEILKKVGKISK